MEPKEVEPTELVALRAKLNDMMEGRSGPKVTQSKIASVTGVQQATLSRFLKGASGLNAESFISLTQYLGGKIQLTPQSAELSQDVCFVDAKVAPAGMKQTPPEAEDYLAVPLVEEVGAGPGLIPQGELKSWFLVYRHQDAIRYRRDLIAVEIGKKSTSMLPTLHPGDIVLVDRQDRDVSCPGRMMLVMDAEGAGKIKRVSVDKAKDDFRVMYYSDNAVASPPELYSLREDFDGNWENCIVGRVVWAWSDVSNK